MRGVHRAWESLRAFGGAVSLALQWIQDSMRSLGRFVSQIVITLGLPILLFLVIDAGLTRRPSYVAVEVVTRAAAFELTAGGAPAELRTLLDPSVKVCRMEWTDVSSRCPTERCDDSVGGSFRAQSPSAFALPLRVSPSARLRVERSRHDRVSVTVLSALAGVASPSALVDARLPFSPGMKVRAADLEIPPRWPLLDQPRRGFDGCPAPEPAPTLEPVPAAIGLEARGGTTTVGFTIAGVEGAGTVLLDTPFEVRSLSLSEQAELGRVERWIESGRIEFPDGEKKSIDLRPQSLVRLTGQDSFLVRSAQLGARGLEIRLDGIASELRVGAAEVRDELPTELEWIFSRAEWQWLIGLVATLLAAMIGVSWSAQGATPPSPPAPPPKATKRPAEDPR